MRTPIVVALAAVMMGSLFPIGAAEIQLSWNDRIHPVDAVVQRKIVEIFRQENFPVSWREPGLGSIKPTQVSVWLVNSTCVEFAKKIKIPVLCQGRVDVVGATLPAEGVNLGLKNRVYVFLPAIRETAKQKLGSCTAEKEAAATALAVAHEVAHLVLGTKRSHDKGGLFASHAEILGSPRFDAKTLSEMRSALSEMAGPETVAAAPPPRKAVEAVLPEPRKVRETATPTLVALANE